MGVFSANVLDIQSWAGPGGFGRTVAAIGVDNALLGQLSAASTRPDLSWKIGSTQVSVKRSCRELERYPKTVWENHIFQELGHTLRSFQLE